MKHCPFPFMHYKPSSYIACTQIPIGSAYHPSLPNNMVHDKAISPDGEPDTNPCYNEVNACKTSVQLAKVLVSRRQVQSL